MTTQLGLSLSMCCPICPEFPFSSPIPLLSSHLYVGTYASVYSHHWVPRTFSMYVTVIFILPSLKSSQTTKSLGPFPLSHFIFIFFYTINNILFPFCLPDSHNKSLCGFTVTFYLHPHFASIHKCVPTSYKDVYYTFHFNYIPLPLSPTLTLCHTTKIRQYYDYIAPVFLSFSAVKVKPWTYRMLPSFSLLLKQIFVFTENIKDLLKSPSHFLSNPSSLC